jgi:hypothetical protein
VEYSKFIEKGFNCTPTSGYKKNRCRMVYNANHDGRHKAHLEASDHLKDTNTESVHSGVVSLHGIWLVVFLAELNGLELWGVDFGNAYLESKTKEEVYIVDGPEFGSLEGHTLLVDKLLYG